MWWRWLSQIRSYGLACCERAWLCVRRWRHILWSWVDLSSFAFRPSVGHRQAGGNIPRCDPVVRCAPSAWAPTLHPPPLGQTRVTRLCESGSCPPRGVGPETCGSAWLPVDNKRIRPRLSLHYKRPAETRINTGPVNRQFTTGFEPLTFLNVINSLHVLSQHRPLSTYQQSTPMGLPLYYI